MNNDMINKKVTYKLTYNNKLYTVKNVPAQVCKKTGEQFFSPQITEKLQELIILNKQGEQDYSKWRQDLFEDLSVEELAVKANNFSKSL